MTSIGFCPGAGRRARKASRFCVRCGMDFERVTVAAPTASAADPHTSSRTAEADVRRELPTQPRRASRPAGVVAALIVVTIAAGSMLVGAVLLGAQRTRCGFTARRRRTWFVRIGSIGLTDGEGHGHAESGWHGPHRGKRGCATPEPAQLAFARAPVGDVTGAGPSSSMRMGVGCGSLRRWPATPRPRWDR